MANIRFDYQKDIIKYGYHKVPLIEFRKWLVQNYETLVRSCFIKMIVRNGVKEATFDWFRAYQIATFSGITHEFLKSIINNNAKRGNAG